MEQLILHGFLTILGLDEPRPREQTFVEPEVIVQTALRFSARWVLYDLCVETGNAL